MVWIKREPTRGGDEASSPGPGLQHLHDDCDDGGDNVTVTAVIAALKRFTCILIRRAID